ncbi:WecB/TagA/CpsF family glycosyltransferase [Agriterribacter sp.]|uniref:WecB/TagA/CpsF family glycosyltransferase n=1 Tax=Agriterribacter sp. TaxID=2821509 RepID=UPI002B712323|nr:WecB/TagA/CpsF family glycosyltransferase [Agriterribacter sp.]HRP55404.1 WecB/TagA/CpsF family glycosyltransferase [Agriterribacter sp.]
MKQRIHLMGTPVDNLTMNETLDIIKCAIERKEHLHHTVVNAGKIVSMHSDPQLRESVIHADIINADGQAVVWASKLLGTPLKERVAGIDLMSKLVEFSFENGYKIFFLGARQKVLEELVSRYSLRYSPEIIAGYRNGYFKKEDEKEIARQIGDSKAHMLFVAITSPIKEIFLYENRDALKNVNFIMGVGGSFDVVAGYVKRAPLWMQRLGLEWLFRVYQEPRRMFKRYLVGNLKFIQLLIKYKLSGRSYVSS